MKKAQHRRGGAVAQAGMTLLELIIACAILLVLSSAALPIARFSIMHKKEVELHRDLREMRDAIDRYKDAADNHAFRTEVGSENYPPDIDTLVKGVNIGANGDRKLRFLRRVPVDPMTGHADWGFRCVSDDPDSSNWCGKNIFDVYSKSTSQAADGTKYSDW